MDKIMGHGSRDIRTREAHLKENYFKLLGLENTDIDKKILDIGGGDGVASMLLGDNFTVLDYSADKYNQISRNAVSGSAENMPFKDSSFDLLISSQALPHLYSMDFMSKENLDALIARKSEQGAYEPFAQDWVEKISSDEKFLKTEKFLRESLRVLMPGGKAKFAPIFEFVNSHPHYAEYFNFLSTTLERLSSELGFEYSFVDITSSIYGNNINGQVKVLRLEIIKKKLN